MLRINSVELKSENFSFISRINFEIIIDFDHEKPNNNKNGQNRF